MKSRKDRIEVLKMLVSSRQMSNQEEIIQAMAKEGYHITQATLSRDFKLLKIAKAASMNGKYVYVLPNETMYKRVTTPQTAVEMLKEPGFISINFSGNLAVIKTRPGYASSIAYNLDSCDIPILLGTIAGDDTIILVIKEGVSHQEAIKALSEVMPSINRQD